MAKQKKKVEKILPRNTPIKSMRSPTVKRKGKIKQSVIKNNDNKKKKIPTPKVKNEKIIQAKKNISVKNNKKVLPPKKNTPATKNKKVSPSPKKCQKQNIKKVIVTHTKDTTGSMRTISKKSNTVVAKKESSVKKNDNDEKLNKNRQSKDKLIPQLNIKELMKRAHKDVFKRSKSMTIAQDTTGLNSKKLQRSKTSTCVEQNKMSKNIELHTEKEKKREKEKKKKTT